MAVFTKEQELRICSFLIPSWFQVAVFAKKGIKNSFLIPSWFRLAVLSIEMEPSILVPSGGFINLNGSFHLGSFLAVHTTGEGGADEMSPLLQQEPSILRSNV